MANIYRYNISISGMDGVGRTWLILHLSFIIHKNGKITRTWPILKSNSPPFSSNNCFPWANNTKSYEKGWHGGKAFYSSRPGSVWDFTHMRLIFMNESFIKISRTCVISQADSGLELYPVRNLSLAVVVIDRQ